MSEQDSGLNVAQSNQADDVRFRERLPGGQPAAGTRGRFSSRNKSYVRDKVEGLQQALIDQFGPKVPSDAFGDPIPNLRSVTKDELTDRYNALEALRRQLEADAEWENIDDGVVQTTPINMPPVPKPGQTGAMAVIPPTQASYRTHKPRKRTWGEWWRGDGVEPTVADRAGEGAGDALRWATGYGRDRERAELDDPESETRGLIGAAKRGWSQALYGGAKISPEERKEGVLKGTYLRWHKWLTGKYPTKLEYRTPTIERYKRPEGIEDNDEPGLYPWWLWILCFFGALLIPVSLFFADVMYSNSIKLGIPWVMDAARYMIYALMAISLFHQTWGINRLTGWPLWTCFGLALLFEWGLMLATIQAQLFKDEPVLGVEDGSMVMYGIAGFFLLINFICCYTWLMVFWSNNLRVRHNRDIELGYKKEKPKRRTWREWWKGNKEDKDDVDKETQSATVSTSPTPVLGAGN